MDAIWSSAPTGRLAKAGELSESDLVQTG